MELAKVVDHIGTVRELKRIASAYVIDYRNLHVITSYSIHYTKLYDAVSGGIDSMVLLHLFEKSGFEYGIAHCNFQLRGDESDGDEQFVRDQVQQHGIPAYFETFETTEYAQVV